ncbi:MAG: NUDIX domain-containing protein [Candidatus Moraniibacteriota bacterium]
MQEILLLNPENVSEGEAATYSIRNAARAVVTDADGLIGLLHVTNEGYFKLPGGGFEGSEDVMSALARECREELGCDVRVTGEIGIVTEYRKKFRLKQISHCFTAEVVGEKGSPAFDEGELAHGFETKWLIMQDLRAVLGNADSVSDESRYEAELYMLPRDRTIFEAAQEANSTFHESD